MSGGYEVLSKGHRVPQGLFLTAQGEILETEHGPKGGDELNIIINTIRFFIFSLD